jgi:hypothetical protein
MALTKADLRTLTKQHLGNRTSTNIDDTWYNARVLSGYRQLCTFQGYVQAPGMRQPQMRRLGFFELQDRQARSLTTALTSNFVTPSPATNVVTVTDIYDRTNNRGLDRRGLRDIMIRDPDATGRPMIWAPAGEGGVVGYYIDRRPGVVGDNIDVYETVYKYPADFASDVATPVIPDVWHVAITYAAAAEGALLLDMPEKHTEMNGKFAEFIAARKSPIEQAAFSGLAGQRRWTPIGARY